MLVFPAKMPGNFSFLFNYNVAIFSGKKSRFIKLLKHKKTSPIGEVSNLWHLVNGFSKNTFFIID